MTPVQSTMCYTEASPIFKDKSIRGMQREMKLTFYAARNLKKGIKRRQAGGVSKFTTEEERAIADLLLSCAAHGFPLNSIMLKKVVYKLGRDKSE